jgi:eukaryotic-like serine/threonine-protein kinase
MSASSPSAFQSRDPSRDVTGPMPASSLRTIGRYQVHQELAHGGMATILLGELRGEAGFSRIVALKRLHRQYASDPEFVSMFTDEARLAARINHANVVHVLDVVSTEGELVLVMEYVLGESLARLMRPVGENRQPIPPTIAAAIVCGTLYGLQAAHEAKDRTGAPLGIVHRDISPENILVGIDGVARVVDFGIAKAGGRVRTTQDGAIRGKIGYFAPEQLHGEPLDHRVDLFAAGVVLWEALTGKRLYGGEGSEEAIAKVLSLRPQPPSQLVRGLSKSLDEVVLRAVARSRSERFATALDMARALEASIVPASPAEVATWVKGRAASALRTRVAMVEELERAGTRQENPGATEAAPHPLPEIAAAPSQQNDVKLLEASDAQPITATMRLGRGNQPSREGRSSLKRSALIVSAGALAIALPLVVFANLTRSKDDAAVATAPGTSAPIVAVGSPSPAEEPRAMPAPGASPIPAAERASTAVAGDGQRADSGRRRPAKIDRRATTGKPATASTPNCEPPYVVDEAGIRRYKPDCFAK